MADSDEAIPEVVVERAQGPEVPVAVAQPIRRASMLSAIAGGAIAAALGFAAAQFVPDGWPLASTSHLEESLATQTASLAAAEQELARLSAALAALEARPAADPSLADRLAALEQRPLPDDSDLTARLDAIEANLSQLAAMPADGSGASPAALAAQATALAALQAEVSALKSGSGSTADIAAAAEAAAAQLAEAEARAAALRTAAEAEAAQALARAALRQIAVALETGGPYATAVSALSETDVPPILADNAATGLPTVTDLQTAFPDVARAALDVALRADMGDGWADRVTGFLRSQTGARSTTPREGDDPDAILSRAEAALGAGSVADAVALVGQLPQVSQDAMAAWIASAQTHVQGQEALVALSASLEAGE